MCEVVAFPAVKFTSTKDVSTSGPPFPIKCVPITKPLDTGWKSWAEWFKVAQALEGLFGL